MEIRDVMNGLLEITGLSAAAFMERIDGTYSTFYKWRDGSNPIGRANQRRIEKEFGVRFVKSAQGEIIGVESVPAAGDVAPVGAIFATADAEGDMRERYDEVARGAHLPRWEDLDEETRAEIRSAWYVALKAAERARNEAEVETVQIVRRAKKS